MQYRCTPGGRLCLREGTYGLLSTQRSTAFALFLEKIPLLLARVELPV